MEQMLALEIWAASVALAGALGWIIGDMRTAIALDQDTDGGVNSTDAERDGLFTLVVPPMAGAGIGTQCDQNGIKANARHPGKAVALPRKMKLDPLSSHLRSEIFASMPPLAELETATHAIRQENPIWHSPHLGEHLADFMRTADLGSLEVLESYRLAIASLTLPDGTNIKSPDQRCMPKRTSPVIGERREATLPIVEISDHRPASAAARHSAAMPDPQQSATRRAS